MLTTSTNSASPTLGPGQYMHFFETGASFTLTTGGSINNVIGNTVFGLQIVPTPEPSSFLMMAGGGLFLFMRLRRSLPASANSL